MFIRGLLRSSAHFSKVIETIQFDSPVTAVRLIGNEKARRRVLTARDVPPAEINSHHSLVVETVDYVTGDRDPKTFPQSAALVYAGIAPGGTRVACLFKNGRLEYLNLNQETSRPIPVLAGYDFLTLSHILSDYLKIGGDPIGLALAPSGLVLATIASQGSSNFPGSMNVAALGPQDGIQGLILNSACDNFPHSEYPVSLAVSGPIFNGLRIAMGTSNDQVVLFDGFQTLFRLDCDSKGKGAAHGIADVHLNALKKGRVSMKSPWVTALTFHDHFVLTGTSTGSIRAFNSIWGSTRFSFELGMGPVTHLAMNLHNFIIVVGQERGARLLVYGSNELYGRSYSAEPEYTEELPANVQALHLRSGFLTLALNNGTVQVRSRS